MKKSMKTLLCVALTLLLLLAAVGCSGEQTQTEPSNAGGSQASQAPETSGGQSAGESLKIGVSLFNMNNPHYVLEYNAIVEAAEANGDTVVMIDPLADSTKQLADVEDLIAQGCDAIIIAPVDTQGISVALKQCSDAGIPVINVDVPVADVSTVAATIATDNYEAGYVLGEAMIEQSGGNAKIGLLERVESEAVRARVEGFEDAIADSPGMEIVIRQSCLTSTEAALPVVENFLQSNPEITDIFCANDLQLLGAVNACEANERTDIRLYGIDGSENGMKLVQEGKAIGTSAQFPLEIGKTAADYARKAALGEEIEKETYIASLFIDKDLVDEYIKVYE